MNNSVKNKWTRVLNRCVKKEDIQMTNKHRPVNQVLQIKTMCCHCMSRITKTQNTGNTKY